MERWQFLGQPQREWPGWLLFRNFACSETKLVIHQFEECLIAEIGDTIEITPANRMTVIKGGDR
jgi:hypothetical protein